MLRPSFEIALQDLKFYARHGVFEQENVIGAEFAVDVSVTVAAPDEVSDELDDTISYADIYEIVKTEMTLPSKLLEHVSYRIAQKLLQTYPQIANGEIEIKKISPPIAGITGAAVVTYRF